VKLCILTNGSLGGGFGERRINGVAGKKLKSEIRFGISQTTPTLSHVSCHAEGRWGHENGRQTNGGDEYPR